MARAGAAADQTSGKETAKQVVDWGSNPSGRGAMESVQDLVSISREELDTIYRAAEPGSIPAGDSRGTAILFPGTGLTGTFEKVARFVWQGKVFNASDSTAINKVFGLRLFVAKVYKAESWLDGKPSIMIDYRRTSWVVGMVRDEIRQIRPGEYLGLVYFRTKPRPTLAAYFALDARPRGS